VEVQPTSNYNIDYAQLPFEFLFGLRAVINVAGFAAAFKLMKYWYEKEYLNSVLQKEKLDAELQSLKAQLHPHFLFNTLNNIYSITENVSRPASDMLLKLSALLRYILYECNRPLVKLPQEFKLIEDYIALEKVRYKHIELDVRLIDKAEGYNIAPLLLLPLVENCFKHGTSQVIEQPWINITTELKENIFAIKLINGKPVGNGMNNFTEGIGLSNVKKRLNLLYPGRHELVVIAEGEVFIVQLKLNLAPANG
jgi:LytS/YehU family sensor histidine kinase